MRRSIYPQALCSSRQILQAASAANRLQLFQTRAPAAPSLPSMKRGRDELDGDGSEEGRGEQAAPPAAAAGGDSEQERQQQQQPGDGQQPPAQQAEEDDEDDRPLLQSYKMSKSLRKGIECPYLDTISRQVSKRMLREARLLGQACSAACVNARHCRGRLA